MYRRPSYLALALLGLATLMILVLPPRVAQRDAVLDTYRTLVEVDALAKLRFVQPITDDRLVDGAIRGMMRKLDPYSGYIAPGEYKNFRRRLDGDYIGVGVDIGLQDGLPVIIAPLEGCPAAAAGVRAGDVVLRVNGRDTTELSVFEVERLLAGEADTLVNLVLRRAGQEKVITKTLVRRRIVLRTVRGFERHDDGSWNYLIDPSAQIGYVRISGFRAKTDEEFVQALRTMRASTLRGLVLDLRFNGGGILEQAVAVCDQFLTGGLIVSTITRRKVVQDYEAHPGTLPKSLRLAVLINGGSASAAEIVAGAMQDRQRAVLVGQRSFGKGSVQQIMRLRSNAGAIKLTVAHYRLPSGRIIHRTPTNEGTDRWGIIPDDVVALTPQENAVLQQAWQGYHKDNLAKKVSVKPGDALASGPRSVPWRSSNATPAIYAVEKDRQLARALELLRQ